MSNYYVAVWSRPAVENNPRSALFVVTEDENFTKVLERSIWFVQETYHAPVGYSTARGILKIYNLTTLMIEAIVSKEGAQVWNSATNEFLPLAVLKYDVESSTLS